MNCKLLLDFKMASLALVLSLMTINSNFITLTEPFSCYNLVLRLQAERTNLEAKVFNSVKLSFTFQLTINQGPQKQFPQTPNHTGKD